MADEMRTRGDDWLDLIFRIGIGQGAALGFGDEIEAGVGYLADEATSALGYGGGVLATLAGIEHAPGKLEQKSIEWPEYTEAESYSDRLKRIRESIKGTRERNREAAIAAELIGAVGGSFVGGAGLGRLGMRLAPGIGRGGLGATATAEDALRVGRGAYGPARQAMREGAIVGGAYGLGTGEGARERVQGGIIGAGAGAAFGGILGELGAQAGAGRLRPQTLDEGAAAAIDDIAPGVRQSFLERQGGRKFAYQEPEPRNWYQGTLSAASGDRVTGRMNQRPFDFMGASDDISREGAEALSEGLALRSGDIAAAQRGAENAGAYPVRGISRLWPDAPRGPVVRPPAQERTALDAALASEAGNARHAARNSPGLRVTQALSDDPLARTAEQAIRPMRSRADYKGAMKEAGIDMKSSAGFRSFDDLASERDALRSAASRRREGGAAEKTVYRRDRDPKTGRFLPGKGTKTSVAVRDPVKANAEARDLEAMADAMSRQIDRATGADKLRAGEAVASRYRSEMSGDFSLPSNLSRAARVQKPMTPATGGGSAATWAVRDKGRALAERIDDAGFVVSDDVARLARNMPKRMEEAALSPDRLSGLPRMGDSTRREVLAATEKGASAMAGASKGFSQAAEKMAEEGARKVRGASRSQRRAAARAIEILTTMTPREAFDALRRISERDMQIAAIIWNSSFMATPGMIAAAKGAGVGPEQLSKGFSSYMDEPVS